MTVSSTQSYVEYNGDGLTKTFTVPFYFLLNTDISVMVADAQGNLSTPVNGTEYSVTGGGDSAGGSLTFNVTYSADKTILIYRNPPVTQETKYYENGKFPAASHEAALDKLTMLIQENDWKFDSLTLRKSTIFADSYDAKNQRISHVSDPTEDDDAVNRRFVTDSVSGFKEYIDSEVAAEAEIRQEADGKLSSDLADEIKARQEADSNIQDQLTGNTPLQASAFSVISWHKQSVDNSVTIPDNVNAWSFGPTVTVSDGQSVIVGEGSFWTIADGLPSESSASNIDYGTL